VWGKEADAIAGLMDRVSSLSRFTVMRARVNPPPVVTGLPGPGSSSSLPKPEQSLIGLARWPGPVHNKEGEPDQQAYGRSFLEATRDAGTQLSQGRIRSLRELWTYAQDWRGSKASSDDRKDYGLGSQRRDEGGISPDMTYLIKPYTYIRDRYKQRSDGTLERPECVSRRYGIRDSIDGKLIVLSSVSIRTKWDEASGKDYLASLHDEHWRGEGPPPFRINHTSLVNSRRIMDHAESLFSRALDLSISRAEAVTTLGELHWWLSHAMPDRRGSAAKTELGVRALAQARGMDLPPFKHGFVPDLEALTRPREDFVKHYASSFSRTPDL
jgi:avirulence protein